MDKKLKRELYWMLAGIAVLIILNAVILSLLLVTGR